MSDLRRLWDETDSEMERALLEAGRSYRCSRGTATKTLAALGLAGSAAVAATGTAGAAALTPLAKGVGIKVLIALSAAGVAGALPSAYRALRPAHHGTSVGQQAPAGATQAPPPSWSAAPGSSGGPDLRVGDVPAAAEAPLLTGAVALVATSRPRALRPSSTLGQEISSLDAARSMLARGNTQEALFLLDGYARGFPRGKLALEAELLRIDALARSGDGVETRRRARMFLARHASSVLAARARTYLED
jgi:hypothetical protein